MVSVLPHRALVDGSALLAMLVLPVMGLAVEQGDHRKPYIMPNGRIDGSIPHAMNLRPYQQEAVAAVEKEWREKRWADKANESMRGAR